MKDGVMNHVKVVGSVINCLIDLYPQSPTYTLFNHLSSYKTCDLAALKT